MPELKACCHQYSIDFISTPFDEPSLEVLSNVGVDALKIASFDIGNLPFINKIAQLGKPTVMSVGGASSDIIFTSVNTILAHHSDLALLHCVSEYPCLPERLGLARIKQYIDTFPTVTIGLSDHFSGVLSGPIGYMMGAKVFEKHVTLNRSWKGTDHSFALEFQGMKNFVRDISRTSTMINDIDHLSLGSEPVFKKLGKSLIAACDINPGDSLNFNNIGSKIFQENGVPVRESHKFIGAIALQKIAQGTKISYDMIDFNNSNNG